MRGIRWWALLLTLVAAGGQAGVPSSASFRVTLRLVPVCQVEHRDEHADGKGQASVRCSYSTPHALQVSEEQDSAPAADGAKVRIRVTTWVF